MIIRKRTARERKAYNEGHLLHLLFGHNFFGSGFGGTRGHYDAAIQAEMQSAWPVLRSAVFALARERSIRRKITRLPAFWWVMDSPEPRNVAETESEQLARMGLSAEILLFG